MGKFSSYPPDTAPTTDDYVLSVDAGTGSNRKVLLSDLLTLFYTQTAIPSGGGSPVTRQSENFFDYVASGMVWAGDAYASTRNASMTSGVCYINGRRISIAAVTARSFTASKDTYIDVLDNADGTGTLVYTEVTNNAASPALAANSIRIGIIITGASNIANVGSVNQGQEDKILPIASSIAYSVTDSLGNLICSRDPIRRTLGYRQILAAQTGITGIIQITGLSVPIKVPTGRKIKAKIFAYAADNNTSTATTYLSIWEGAVSAGTRKGLGSKKESASNSGGGFDCFAQWTPSSANITINAGYDLTSGTGGIYAGATNPTFIEVELG